MYDKKGVLKSIKKHFGNDDKEESSEKHPVADKKGASKMPKDARKRMAVLIMKKKMRGEK